MTPKLLERLADAVLRYDCATGVFMDLLAITPLTSESVDDHHEKVCAAAEMVRRAFYHYTSSHNSWEHCQTLNPNEPFLRRMFLGTPHERLYLPWGARDDSRKQGYCNLPDGHYEYAQRCAAKQEGAA